MRLHDYAASGNCYKARLLLALTDQPYERVAVDIFAGDTLTPEFERLNPVRETPVLELDSGETITQSNAILWYLAKETDFLPTDRLDRARVVQWLSFEQEHVLPGLGGTRFRLATGRAALDRATYAKRFEAGLEALRVLDSHLDGRLFLVGERCSIADLSVFAYTQVANQAGFELSAFPAVEAWLDRVRALPGFVADDLRYPENAQQGRSRSIYD